MKAFAYIRVSGAAQIDGDGPERQREKIADFCIKHGLLNKPIAPEEWREFFDQGVSGTVDGMDRPELLKFFQYVDECEKERPWGEREESEQICLVVERMDRLARTLVVQEVLMAECKKRGIKVFAADRGELVDQASDGADPSVVLIRQILGAVAQWEKSVIVMKLKAAKDRMRRETGRCEGPRPYGSTEAERKILELIENGVAAGRSFNHIAGSLNLCGLKTRTGKEWNKARVSHAFRNGVLK